MPEHATFALRRGSCPPGPLQQQSSSLYRSGALPWALYVGSCGVQPNLQTKLLRQIASFYVTNVTLHNDLNIPFLHQLAKKKYQKFHTALSTCSNPLVLSDALYLKVNFMFRKCDTIDRLSVYPDLPGNISQTILRTRVHQYWVKETRRWCLVKRGCLFRKVLLMPDSRLPKILAKQIIDKRILWHKDNLDLCNKMGLQLDFLSGDMYENMLEALKKDFRKEMICKAQKSSFHALYKDLKLFSSEDHYISDHNSLRFIRDIFKLRGQLIKLNFGICRSEEQRRCSLCISNEMEDVYHYLGVCTTLQEWRVKWFGKKCLTPNEVINQLNEIEASEACQWLRAAGFPQYAQMYEGNKTVDLIPDKVLLEGIKQRIEVYIRGYYKTVDSIRGYYETVDSIRGYDKTVDSIRGYDKTVDSIGSYDKTVDSIRGYDKTVDSIRGYDKTVDSIGRYDKTVDSTRGYDKTVDSIRGYDKTVDSIGSYDKTVDSIRGYDKTVYSIRGYDKTVDSIGRYDKTVDSTRGYDKTVDSIREHCKSFDSVRPN
uniref:SAM domain-containing protein n=1 Tax=Rhodnius prolixus TaxID=13249 RepID=T1IA94_RHOPR